MKTYQLTETDLGDNLIVIDKNGVASAIPIDPANSDYQAYLRWLNGEEETGTISQEYGETVQGWRSIARAAGR